jgi:hypothetical protein
MIVTALDVLRRQIDHDDFDAAIFALDAVAADLGYGDVRPLPRLSGSSWNFDGDLLVDGQTVTGSRFS